MTSIRAAGDVTVRRATREDAPRVHQMIVDLATYEGFPDGPLVKVEDLIRDGFEGSPRWFFVVLAERRGACVGQAMCNYAYSSWTGRALYIEDLFVAPAERRAGVGAALLRHLAQMCVEEGITRIDWHVAESNSSALSFYSRLGARDLRRSEGRAALRLDAPEIRALAAVPDRQ